MVLLKLEAQAQQQCLRTSGCIRNARLPASEACASASVAVAGGFCCRQVVTTFINRVSPCSTNSVAESSVSGMFCATSAMPPGCNQLGNVDIARIGMQSACQQRKQRRLACAIAPDQADFFAWVDGGAGAVQHRLDPTQQGHVLEHDHGWVSSG